MDDEGIQQIIIETSEYDEETSKRHADLYAAAHQGDWSKAEEIFKKHPGDVQAELSDVGDTVLHVAVTAGRKDFVKKLVSKYLGKDELEKKNKEENTAFFIAAMSGSTELAEMMLEKNMDLVMIWNGGTSPVLAAALLGHEMMVKYLYTASRDYLTEGELTELLVTLIDNDLYDVALWTVKEFPSLAVTRTKDNRYGKTGITALHALARKPLMDYDFNKSKQGIMKRYYNQPILGTNQMQNIGMNPKALELVQLLWVTIVDRLPKNEISKFIGEPRRLMFDAAKEGNIDFLSIISSKHPDLLLQVNEQNYTIFHIAVSYRHENIFKLVHERPAILVSLLVGNEENNILHLAAKLPPDLSRLEIVPGAALQMQRELWWFKEVSRLMPPIYAKAKNAQGKTARTLFTESHKELMKEGEGWMKKTAESCMLVATLIVTIVFAAAFTVPGGLNNNTGTPLFVRKASFIVFAISETISLVLSISSLLTFLSIFIVRYAEEDFFKFLPTMLQFGLYTLFISLIGMMVVFCTTLFIVFAEGTVVAPVLGIAIAPIPIIVFSHQQKILTFDVYRLISKSLFPENQKIN